MSYTLYQGDCFHIMPQLPSGSINAIISDPPYGTTDLFWDQKIDLGAFWQEAARLCTETAIIALFSQQPFTTDLINSNRKWFRYEMIWHKTMAVGWLSANQRPLRAHENILIFAKKFAGSTYNPQKEQGHKPYISQHTGPVALYGRQRNWPSVARSISGERYPRSVLCFANGGYTHRNPRLHPTQKPLGLVQWILQTYANVGDAVLDPFMGSGTTGIACLQTGRNFIGIEEESDYFRVAQARLQSETQFVRAESPQMH